MKTTRGLFPSGFPGFARAAVPALLLAGAWTGMSSAAETRRVDMDVYLPPAAVGWTTAWEYDDGSSATEAIQEVAMVDGGKSVTTRRDASDGSWLETDIVYRDHGTHYGTITSVVPGGSGVILPARPGSPDRLQPRMQRIGRTYRSRVIRGNVIDFATGDRIGRFVRRETTTLGGFEDRTTPGGFYSQALRQDWTADTRYFFIDKSRLRNRSSGTWWWAAGQGVVAGSARLLIYLNRVFDSDSGTVDGWRVSLTVPAGGPFDLAVYAPSR